jgi:hypothetical protein
MQHENASRMSDQELLDMLKATLEKPLQTGLRVQWAIVLRREILRRGFQTET